MYLTVAAYGTKATSGFGTAIVMQYVNGSWVDLTYNLGWANSPGQNIPPSSTLQTANITRPTSIAHVQDTLCVSDKSYGMWYLRNGSQVWRQPADWGFNYGRTAVVFPYAGGVLIAGPRIMRYTSIDGDFIAENTNGMDTISAIFTSLSGQEELLVSRAGHDEWRSYSLPNLTLTSTDDRSGSCGFDLFEHNGIIHSANFYGWTYRSTNGRTFGVHDDDIDVPDTPDNHNIWSLFKVGSNLYGGTCRFGGGTCEIRRFTGVWSTSPVVATKSVSAYGQGFVRGLQDINNPAQAFISTGIGSYDVGSIHPDESRVYVFNGSTLTDISPPVRYTAYPNERFGTGIQAMCFAPLMATGPASSPAPEHAASGGWSVG